MTEHKTQWETRRAYKKEMARFMKNWTAQPSVAALFEESLTR